MGISYKHFLYGALTFVSLLGAMLKVMIFSTPGNGPMEFCFGIVYLAFLTFTVGQLWTIHTREQQPAESREDMPEQDRLNEDTLAAAETYLSMGENLDMVCEFVNPRYRDWDTSKRLTYRQSLRFIIEKRRGNVQADESGCTT